MGVNLNIKSEVSIKVQYYFMETSVPVQQMKGKARNVCVTWNNYTNQDYNKILDYCKREAEYAVIGEEIGESGTEHIQAFIHYKSPRSLQKIKDDLSHKIHIEVMYSTVDAASDYCKKEGKYIEIGIKPQQGERTDWRMVFQMIRNGATLEDILTSFPHLIPQQRAIRDTMFNLNTRRVEAVANRDIDVIVLIGDAGAGKTKWIYENYPYDEIYIKPACKGSGQYFDGYNGQKVMVYDDFYGDIKYHDLLRYLDRYPVKLPIHGGFTEAKYDTVIITSNREPVEWYKEYGVTPALRRRLKKIIHFRIIDDVTTIQEESVSTKA